MDANEAKVFIASKLAPKIRRTLTPADFSEAWTGLAADLKLSVVNAAIDGKEEAVGEQLGKMLNSYARTQAEIRAATMVANGTLDIDEFSEIFD